MTGSTPTGGAAGNFRQWAQAWSSDAAWRIEGLRVVNSFY